MNAGSEIIWKIVVFGFGIVNTWMLFLMKSMYQKHRDHEDEQRRIHMRIGAVKDRMTDKYARKDDLDHLEERIVRDLGDIKKDVKKMLLEMQKH